MVKADAYGHGLVPVARACVAAGAQRFCVATLEEGLRLRRAGVSVTIHPLSPLLPEEAEDCVRANLTPFISSPAFFDAFVAAAKDAPQPAPCFLMLDTGMGREGMDAATFHAVRAACPPWVELVGVATHLASADEPERLPTDNQLADFERQTEHTVGLLSACNSPGMLRWDEHGIVRAGAILYGIEPYPEAFAQAELALRPAMALKARLTLVKALPAGATVGYGRTHTLTRDSMIATVPAGYGDGWLRPLGNRGFVLVRGQRCPIVGRVSMDQCQIDVTEIAQVALGETVTLIGEGITACDVAQWAQTTPHEPTTLLSSRVPRYYL